MMESKEKEADMKDLLFEGKEFFVTTYGATEKQIERFEDSMSQERQNALKDFCEGLYPHIKDFDFQKGASFHFVMKEAPGEKMIKGAFILQGAKSIPDDIKMILERDGMI